MSFSANAWRIVRARASQASQRPAASRRRPGLPGCVRPRGQLYPRNPQRSRQHIFASGRTRVARGEWGAMGEDVRRQTAPAASAGATQGPFVGGNRASGPARPTHAPRPMVRPVQPPAKTAPAASANRLETRCRAQAPGRRPCSIARPPSVPSGSRTISRSRIGPSLVNCVLTRTSSSSSVAPFVGFLLSSPARRTADTFGCR